MSQKQDPQKKSHLNCKTATSPYNPIRSYSPHHSKRWIIIFSPPPLRAIPNYPQCKMPCAPGQYTQVHQEVVVSQYERENSRRVQRAWYTGVIVSGPEWGAIQPPPPSCGAVRPWAAPVIEFLWRPHPALILWPQGGDDDGPGWGSIPGGPFWLVPLVGLDWLVGAH